MLQGIVEFFEFLDVNLFWPALDIILIFIWSIVGSKDLKYKIKEEKKEDGTSEYKVWKYK